VSATVAPRRTLLTTIDECEMWRLRTDHSSCRQETSSTITCHTSTTGKQVDIGTLYSFSNIHVITQAAHSIAGS